MEKLIEQFNKFFEGGVRVEIVEGHLEITTDSQKILFAMPKIIGIDSTGL